MKLARWCVLFLTLLGVPAGAIVNGTVVSAEQFQQRFGWAVALQYPDYDGVCTGQLIAASWVLTAAHCTSAAARVVVGDRDRTVGPGLQSAEAIRHPGFDARTGENDVGLIRLKTPLAQAPVRLMSPAEAPGLLKEGARAIIAGWGSRSSNSGHSLRLVVSDVELRNLQVDKGRFAYFDPVSGPCGGDSGGPLLLSRPDGTWVLAGVASRVMGNLCAQGGGVGIYVNVAAMRDFIDSHVKGLPH